MYICSDYLFKVLLIGDSGVGKSCLLLRFAVWYLYFYSSIWFWSISSKPDESAFYIYRMILIWRVTSVPLGSTLSVLWILFLGRELWPIFFIVIFLVGIYISSFCLVLYQKIRTVDLDSKTIKLQIVRDSIFLAFLSFRL